ncbi:MAG: hypothetical protein KME10_22415 [Plectolyngbya sp. WJT66-NPBG17]|jgi:NO-binding membrane sensor protein with MHYT domain|nr:hypothetical protein [Plectolyngbya sp. WJT66-NPBG17]MBW4525545.1 hypothetical protein [Phormidium tanganyikae FI6-MK23]
MPPHTEDLVANSDFRLIVLSVLVSCIGSYTALDIAEQISIGQEHPRQYWLIGSGIVLGLAIWAMHFTVNSTPREGSCFTLQLPEESRS